jgi:hypothetical protein
MSKTANGGKFKNLIAHARKGFSSLDLKIKTKRINDLEPNEFYVNAYYDAEDDANGFCPIEVVILHNIDPDNYFEHSQAGQLVVHLYDAIVHELRHQYQSRCRNYLTLTHSSVDDVQAYLSDPDEIDAYALSISIELIRNLGRTRSIQYLHRASRLAMIRPKGLYASPNLFAYFEAFGKTEHPIIRKLIKKVFLNLETLDKNAVFY